MVDLTCELDLSVGQNNAVTGTGEFCAAPGNPSVPAGHRSAFHVNGQINGTQVTLALDVQRKTNDLSTAVSHVIELVHQLDARVAQTRSAPYASAAEASEATGYRPADASRTRLSATTAAAATTAPIAAPTASCWAKSAAMSPMP